MAHDRELSRRGVLRSAALGGVAAPLLTACGAAEETPSAAQTSASGASVAAADVPVGGGTILADEKIVVTQPTAGEFKAFSAVCTHKRCPVSSVNGGEITCPCHGSRFSIEDGSVVAGPAPAPLPSKTATLSGDRVTVS